MNPAHFYAVSALWNGLLGLFLVYSTKAEHGKGTGLGLYIAKQLAGRSGGRISVKSKPDHGTTFTLEFKNVLEEA